MGTYFSNTTLSGAPSLLRVDSTVNFNWGSGSPGGSLPVDNFSARWTGYVLVQTTGTYYFQTVSDDGVRLYVNGSLLINNWSVHATATDTSVGVALTAGVSYPIALEYYDSTGTSQITLNWKKPGDGAFSVLPASNGSLGLSNKQAGGVPGAQWWSLSTSLGLANGASISSWTNEADNSNNLTAGATKPVMRNNNSQNINFNPVVEFTATTASDAAAQYFSATSMLGSSSYTTVHVAFVGYPTSTGQQNGVVHEDAVTPSGEMNGELTVNLPYDNSDVFWNAGSYPVNQTGYSAARLVSAPSVYLFTMDNSATTKQASRQDGSVMASTTTARKTMTGNGSAFRVGYGSSGLSPFRGLMAEGTLIVGTSLSSTDISQIESYLGIKYGVTLGGAGAGSTSYLSAGGSTVWAAGTGYHRNVTGVGRDDDTGLDQRISRSVNSGTQITVSTSTAASLPTGASTVSPQAGTAFPADGSYVVVGDNGGTASATSTIASGTLAGGTRSARVWRIQTTGTLPAQFTLCLPDSMLPAAFTSGTTLGVLATDSAFTAVTATVAASAGTCPGSGVGVTASVSGRVVEVSSAALPASGSSLYFTLAQPAPLDHLAITATGSSGLTCTPTTFTITACANAACSSNYTGGLTGSLSLTGTGMTVNYPSGAGFTIGSGSSSTTVSAQVTTVGSVTVSATGLSVTPANAQPVFCGLGVGAAQANTCSFAAADSGLLFNVPNHAAENSQTVAVQAVRKSDNSLGCTPAFASVSKSITFKCSYTNPGTGTLPVRVGGSALNAANSASAACDATGRAVSLSFDATGSATTSFVYADVGQVLLTASYTGSGSDAGLSMTGTDSFIAAPTSFGFSGITAAPIRAGASFSATVTAQNALGSATPNFGRESSPEGATLGFARRSPTGAGAATGSFSGSLGSFSAGAATASNLAYTEVGTGDLTATLTSGSYLGTGLTATGTTGAGGAVGRFTPHHFDVAVTPGCSASFTYAGQTFSATVTARNLAGATTLNYDGSASTSPNYAKAVTLSEATALGVGSFTGTGIASSAFSAGVAATSSPVYSFTTKQTSARTLTVRATDTDSISSSGYTEGSTALRSGRLRISNAFGSAIASLQVPVTAEYWGGNAWVLNASDSCTSIAASAVGLSNPRNALGNTSAATSAASGTVTLSTGQANLALGAPSPAGSTVSYDIAINLGSTTADQSCAASHPTTTGAARPWLRSANGSCSALWDRDPAARISFGIFSPETRKTVRTRELF